MFNFVNLRPFGFNVFFPMLCALLLLFPRVPIAASPIFLSAEPNKPASGAGSESGGGGKKPQGLGEWKADFEDAGSVALSSTSHPSQAKKSKAGTAATTDSEVMRAGACRFYYAM